jgi:hypothetical protein
MRPSVAITATELGVTLGKTRTVMSVDRALELAAKSDKPAKAFR